MRVWLFSAVIISLLLSQVALADITIDKEVYKPGEIVHIELYYPHEIDNVELSMMQSEDYILSKRPMKNLGSNTWGYNHTLSKATPSGVYTINIDASEIGTIVNSTNPNLNFKKSFNVSAWEVETTINKNLFDPGERLNLSVLISEKYSDDLEFKISYAIIDPLGYNVSGQTFTISGVSKGFIDFFDIPDNYSLGTSEIMLNITDSDRRFYQDILEFEVSDPILLSLDKIEEDITDEVVYKTILLKNRRDYQLIVNSVDINGDAANAVSVIQKPYVILPNEEAAIELEIDATAMKQDVLGSVVVKVNQIDYEIPIKLKYDMLKDIEKLQENVNIIWCFAIGIVAIIVIITVIRYRKIKKKKEEEAKAKAKKKEEKQEFFVETGGQYRTEYY